MTRRDRFRFHLANGGYCTPPGRAACAGNGIPEDSRPLCHDADMLALTHRLRDYDRETGHDIRKVSA